MYTYDKNGNILSITSDDKAFYSIENKYFPNSKEIEQKISNFQGIEGTLIVFDKNNHIIEQKITDLYRNKIDYHYTFKNKVDTTGNLIEGLRYNNLLKYNDALTKITYEYY